MSVSEFAPNYLAVEERPDAVIARFTVTRLTDDVNLEQVGHELFALVDQYGCRKLVVSLGNIDYLASSGIGKLITLHRKMHRVQGAVVFCELQPTVGEILRASRLVTYFKICEDLDAALSSLQSTTPGSES